MELLPLGSDVLSGSPATLPPAPSAVPPRCDLPCWMGDAGTAPTLRTRRSSALSGRSCVELPADAVDRSCHASGRTALRMRCGGSATVTMDGRSTLNMLLESDADGAKAAAGSIIVASRGSVCDRLKPLGPREAFERRERAPPARSRNGDVSVELPWRSDGPRPSRRRVDRVPC